MRILKENVTARGCKILFLDCRNPEDILHLKMIQEEARGQSPHFKDIFPWRKEHCNGNYDELVMIAHSPEGICGWMTMIYSGGEKNIFVTEVTTRASKDRSFGGLGRTMFDQLDIIAKEMGVKYIYLFPLGTVRGFYERIGYSEIDSSPHMFKIIAGYPTRKKLEELKKSLAQPDEDILGEIRDQLSSSEARKFSTLVRNPINANVATDLYTQTEDIGYIREWMDTTKP